MKFFPRSTRLSYSTIFIPECFIMNDTFFFKNISARKRWRLAFAAIYCLRVILSIAKDTKSKRNDNGVSKTCSYTIHDFEPSLTFTCDTVSGIRKPEIWSYSQAQRRWRIVYVTISFVQIMVSHARKIKSEEDEYYNSEILEENLSIILEIDPSSSSNPSEIYITDTAIDGAKLAEVVREKNLKALHEFGEVKGLATALKTNLEKGINGDHADLGRRREMFGSNTYHKPPPKGFIYFVLETFKDITILILLVCAALSLGFGIKEHGVNEGWYEGGSIAVAVFLVVVVSASSNFRQENQFDKLSKISNNIKVEVLRDSRRQQISIFDVVVGDIAFLKIGDQIPADGLFLDGHSLQVDESSMTGESDHVEINSTLDPFLLSGSKAVDGYGRMLVTSVGMKTAWGEMMSSITQENEEQTPLQVRLNTLTSSIGKVGLSVALLVLLVLLVRYFTGNTTDENGNKEYNGSKTEVNDVFDAIIRIIAAAVTIVVVAIPEGLPLAVTLTLAYSMKRMMVDQAMVRKLSACETMGSATVICTDKTGTLTLNKMTVTKFWLGQSFQRDDSHQIMAQNIYELIYQGVSFNTTGSVYKPLPGSIPEISGSPTEKAILSWAILELGMDMEKMKKSHTILHVETFNSDTKRSGVAIKKESDGTIHVHWKGAAEIVLAMCSDYYESDGTIKPLDKDKRSIINKIIQGMAASTLRCIAFAHRQISEDKIYSNKDDGTRRRLKDDDFMLLGIIGLKDPCRPGVKKAVQTCKSAGVSIKMITGDNIFTAKAIATECGILDPDYEVSNEEVIEGTEFRNYTHEERMQKVDKILVMARSSPLDKLLMVRCLKQKGHVVAVTGDGTNDAPALKEADVGLSMGVEGTEVAKESSDIVILDDNFTSVATVLKWGRCVYNNIQKFIQFQLTVNVAALVINFIAAVSAGEVPLTTVQLLWVNLIMDTLGALALATERPTNELMHHPPVGRTEPLITNIMWRNLLSQALYQIAILLIFQFKGESLLNVGNEVKNTVIFNTFVLCQVFNEFNSRRLEKKNIFEGISKNHLFLGIVGITILLQVMMVEFMGKFAKTVKLNSLQWGVCIAIAALTWPIGWLVKSVPVSEKPFLSYLRKRNSHQ